jgi:hypothetical protein
VKKLVEKIREKKLKEKVLEGWKNESKKNEFVRLGRKYLLKKIYWGIWKKWVEKRKKGKESLIKIFGSCEEYIRWKY